MFPPSYPNGGQLGRPALDLVVPKDNTSRASDRYLVRNELGAISGEHRYADRSFCRRAAYMNSKQPIRRNRRSTELLAE
jgi:hypothetical protein